MSLWSVSLALARLALGVMLVGAAAPLVGGEAAAFGPGLDKTEESADAGKGAKGGKGDSYTPEQIKARAEARKRLEEEEEAKGPQPQPQPARAAVVKVVKQKPAVPQDVEVAGCASGMSCVVCVAGCNGQPQSIVSVVPGRRQQ